MTKYLIGRSALGLLVVGALAAGCATTSEPASGGTGHAPRVGGRLPALTVKTFDGDELDLGALDGKVVLLDIWASWCAPCKEELPLLDAMAARLKRKGVTVVAVSIDENRDDAVQFLHARSKPWSLSLAHDPDAHVADALKPPKMPTSYIVDRRGVIQHINEGFDRADAATIESRLTDLAAQNP